MNTPSPPSALRAVLPIFIVTRLGVLAAGYFALMAFGWANKEPPNRISTNELVNLPYRFDAGWYLGIARDGYEWSRGQRGQQSIAFFPAYPLAVRAVRATARVRLITAAMITTLAAALGGFVYLYRLAREDLDDERARTAVVLLATYPFAVFFSAPYSESIFLLASVGAWFHFRRRNAVRAAIFGLVCGLARPNGALLSIPLALMALQFVAADRPLGTRVMVRSAARWLTVAAMPGVGLALYGVYLHRLTGNALAWVVAQQAWGRHYTPPVALLREWWRTPAFFDSSVAAAAMIDYLTGAIIIALLCLAVPIWRRFGAPAAVLIVVWILPPVLGGGLMSMGRITSIVFPAFIWLGATIPPRHRTAWATAFMVVQTLMAAMFFTWRPVF